MSPCCWGSLRLAPLPTIPIPTAPTMPSQAFPQPAGESSTVTTVAQGAFLLLIFSSLEKAPNFIIRPWEMDLYRIVLDLLQWELSIAIQKGSLYRKFILIKSCWKIVNAVYHSNVSKNLSRLSEIILLGLWRLRFCLFWNRQSCLTVEYGWQWASLLWGCTCYIWYIWDAINQCFLHPITELTHVPRHPC